ncbi:MAG: hypothetical protein A2Y66_01910 [Nitrospirae bacterium RBG_13_41_22]|nr:MAG: hypothetical protein A2Y66_01910 [Nitrospirae bacterium RBG_13_41_22]
MSIKITTEKVIIQGIQFYKITRLEALQAKDLPTEYLKGSPSFYLKYDIFYSTNTTKGDIELKCYTAIELAEKIEYLKLAGQRLTEINKHLAEKNKNWHGEETFII